MVACLLGGLLGAAMYIGLIEMHHDPSDDVIGEAERLAQAVNGGEENSKV